MKQGIPTIVKWAGGKKQLISQIDPLLPKKIERYFEPFVGGGAVAFHILEKHNPKEVILSDTNEELILTYNMIKNNVEELITKLKIHRKNHNEDYFYAIRDLPLNLLSDVEKASRFIYLNKTCFNGLYRVNSKGKFNVPIGSYKNPSICSEEDLRKISDMLKKVEIKVLPFEKVLDYASEGDFVYFDPPYYPLKRESFTSYAKDKFLEVEQVKLSEVFKRLDGEGCNVMLSNSDTDFIKDLYKSYNINLVEAKRMINSKGNGRGKINEVVVTNY